MPLVATLQVQGKEARRHMHIKAQAMGHQHSTEVAALTLLNTSQFCSASHILVKMTERHRLPFP